MQRGQGLLVLLVGGVFLIATLAVFMPSLFDQLNTAQAGLISSDNLSYSVVLLVPALLFAMALGSILMGVKSA